MTEIRTKLSILCDNFISAPDFMGQHGFSSLIEREDRKLLFDCGLRPSLEHNLETLGNNLAGLSGIMLSHGHYDHTDGLRWALEQAGRVEITAHPGMFEQHLALPRHEGGGAVREIGCPYSREELESLGAEFRFLDHTDGVAPGIRFLTSVRRKEGQSPVDPQLLRPGVSGTLEPDPIDDDASLLLDTTSGPVLLLGCAHAGAAQHFGPCEGRIGDPPSFTPFWEAPILSF